MCQKSGAAQWSNLVLSYFLTWLALSHGFQPHVLQPARRAVQSEVTNSRPLGYPSALNLTPVRDFKKELQTLSQERGCLDKLDVLYDGDDRYELCVVDEKDLPDTSRFIVQCFGAEAIRLSNNLNSLEEMVMRPAVDALNGYSGIVAFAEVLAGLRSRIQYRITEGLGILPPSLDGLDRDEAIRKTAGTALVLILARQRQSSDWEVDIIGSIELRLQPADAKIPFTLPWLDRFERGIASLIGIGNHSRDLQPYLGNLCVSSEFRGKKIGRVLVDCVEEIASEVWGYSRIYLHVDVDNTPALQLYKSGGYQDVGRRWKPFWAGAAADIGYFYKNLR